jgi:phenol 2-monooxygenase
MDFVPSSRSNFPDWRTISTINSKETGIMLIPREAGKVRLYIELGDEEDLKDPVTGRVNMTRYSTEKMLDVCFISNTLDGVIHMRR